MNSKDGKITGKYELPAGSMLTLSGKFGGNNLFLEFKQCSVTLLN